MNDFIVTLLVIAPFIIALPIAIITFWICFRYARGDYQRRGYPKVHGLAYTHGGHARPAEAVSAHRVDRDPLAAHSAAQAKYHRAACEYSLDQDIQAWLKQQQTTTHSTGTI